MADWFQTQFDVHDPTGEVLKWVRERTDEAGTFEVRFGSEPFYDYWVITVDDLEEGDGYFSLTGNSKWNSAEAIAEHMRSRFPDAEIHAMIAMWEYV